MTDSTAFPSRPLFATRARPEGSPAEAEGSESELPDARYFIQHSPNAGWNDVGIGGNPEQSHSYKKNDASSEQSFFHGRILSNLPSLRLPKLRIGGLQQESPAVRAAGLVG